MINLIPTEEKRQIRAARANSILVRYTFVLLMAGAFLGLVLAGSYFLLTLTKSSSEALIEANDTKADAYSNTQNQITALTSNLTEAQAVFEQQLSYSKTLSNIGASLPAGVVLEKIALTPESFTGTPTTLKVYARDNQSTVTLRETFSTSPYFSNVNLDSVSETGGIDGYPVTASLTVTLNRIVAQ